MASYGSLPYGWMMEFDLSTNHPYWVDTQANPPRSTWVHPYQDEQYLSEHPEIREQLMDNAQYPSNITCSQPPPYNYSASPNQDVYRDTNASCPQKLNKKSFYGKLKARVTGNTGRPEAEERLWKEESSQNLQAQIQERRRQLQMAVEAVEIEQRTARGQRPTLYVTPAGDSYFNRGRRRNEDYRG